MFVGLAAHTTRAAPSSGGRPIEVIGMSARGGTVRLLVTGGAGYVGGHTVRSLLDAGHEVVVFDNLVYGHAGFGAL